MNQSLSGYFRTNGHLRRLIAGCIQDFINTHKEVTKVNADSLARRIVGQIRGIVLHSKDKQEFCCYHITTIYRLPSILECGLEPNSQPSWFNSKTPYVMLSLYPYWSLFCNGEARGLTPLVGDSFILLEIKDPAIKREYFDNPEGLRWPYNISPKYFNAVIKYNVIQHGMEDVHIDHP